jgi:hypothetical protein
MKAVMAPKTQDANYEEACAALASYSIKSDKFASSLTALLKQIHELGSIWRKCSDDATKWATEDAPAEDLSAAERIASFSASFDEFTDTSLTYRLEPNFLLPFRAYEASVGELHKLKEQRENARKEFDRDRPIQTQLQNAKKAKQSDIDKAKAKADEAERKYIKAMAAEEGHCRSPFQPALGRSYNSAGRGHGIEFPGECTGRGRTDAEFRPGRGSIRAGFRAGSGFD